MKFLVIEKTSWGKYYLKGDNLAFNTYADAERVKEANESICKIREGTDKYMIVEILEEDNLEVVNKTSHTKN